MRKYAASLRALGLALVYLIEPALFRLFDRLSDWAMHGICGTALVLMLTDAVVSYRILSRIRQSADLTTGADDTEALTRYVRKVLAEKGTLMRRAMTAFPYMRLYNSGLLRAARERQQAIRQESAARQRRMREEFDRYQQKLREYAHKTRGGKAD